MRKKHIQFFETHSSEEYVFKFEIMYGNRNKTYELTIECSSSRIVHIALYKNSDEKLIEINNRDGSLFIN